MFSDVIVVGGGIVGWAAALGLRLRGLSVILVYSSSAPLGMGRTIALLGDSIPFIRSLGLWDDLAPYVMPIEGLHIIDATDSLFSMLPQSFTPQEVDRDIFGYSIALENLLNGFSNYGVALERSESEGFKLYRGVGQEYRETAEGVTLTLEDGTCLCAQILIAADGVRSLMRHQAGIDVQMWSYSQQALTMLVSHEANHKKHVIEYHMRSGPLTLLPVQQPLNSKFMYDFSSHIVWVVSPEQGNAMQKKDSITLGKELESAVHSVWGPMAIESAVNRISLKRLSASQLTKSRIYLVGESAHQWSPLGAQGLNSGLSDVAALVDVLDHGYRHGLDLSHASIGKMYEHARRHDLAIRGGVIHAFNNALLAQTEPARIFWDGIRSMGGVLLESFPGLRRHLIERTLTSSRV